MEPSNKLLDIETFVVSIEVGNLKLIRRGSIGVPEYQLIGIGKATDEYSRKLLASIVFATIPAFLDRANDVDEAVYGSAKVPA